MAFNPLPIREARRAALYDGTNSADFNTAISDFQIVSENASGLTFTSGGQQYTVAPNGYLAWYQGEVTEVFQNANDYHEVYADLANLDGHVHDLVLTTGPAKAPSEDA
jgi:hypothetical protein